MGRSIYNIPVVVDLIFFFVTVKVGLYYLLPTAMRILSGYQFELDDGVSVSSLVFLYSLELISWAIWMLVLLTILYIAGRGRKKRSLREFAWKRYYDSRLILTILVSGFIVTKVLAWNNVMLPAPLEVFKSLLFYGGLTAGPFLMVVSLRLYNKWFFLLGVSATILALLSVSSRGALVYVVIFGFFLSWFVLRDRKITAIIVAVACSIAGLYFMFGGLVKGSIVVDNSEGIIFEAGIDREKKEVRTAFEEIEWRFGAATRMGTAFIDLYDRGDGA